MQGVASDSTFRSISETRSGGNGGIGESKRIIRMPKSKSSGTLGSGLID